MVPSLSIYPFTIYLTYISKKIDSPLDSRTFHLVGVLFLPRKKGNSSFFGNELGNIWDGSHLKVTVSVSWGVGG